MGEIYNWVKNIIIFLVLTTIISNLLGKSNYKKYINLVTGIILVLLVISPILKLFKLEDTLDYFFSTNSLLAEAEDMSGKLIEMEQGQMTAIFDEYKVEIEAQVRNLLEEQELYIVNIDVDVDEVKESITFGTLEHIDIIASNLRQDTSVISVETTKIDIDKIEIGDKKEQEVEADIKNLSPSEINAKNLLSDFYNMNPDNINISIQVQ